MVFPHKDKYIQMPAYFHEIFVVMHTMMRVSIIEPGTVANGPCLKILH